LKNNKNKKNYYLCANQTYPNLVAKVLNNKKKVAILKVLSLLTKLLKNIFFVTEFQFVKNTFKNESKIYYFTFSKCL